MTEYALKDENGNELALNDATVEQPAKGSLTLGSDSYSYENRVVENSALPGSVKLGETRVRQREIRVSFQRAFSDDVNFRQEENELIEFVKRAKWLVDKERSLQIELTPDNYEVSYDDGARLHSADVDLTFLALTPFWEEIIERQISRSLGVGISTIVINNDGYLATPPRFEFKAPSIAPITQVIVYVDDNKQGIQIDDSLFGTVGYDDMVVDCKEGTLFLESFDRSLSILLGTGYFDFPIGQFTLKFDVSSPVDVDIFYARRYYI